MTKTKQTTIMKLKVIFLALIAINIFVSCDIINPKRAEQKRKEAAEQLLSKNLMNTVDRISQRSELVTAEATISKIAKGSDTTLLGDRKIAYSCVAYLKAGIELKSFHPTNIKRDTALNSITITLPHAKLLSYNLPVENIREEYVNTDSFRRDFSAEQRHRIKVEASKDIQEHVAEYGLLEKAEDNARIIFAGIFRQLGFDSVFVTFE